MICFLTPIAGLFAQNDVNLILNHQFNGNPLSYVDIYQDANGNAIQITRMQYYLSSIEVTHDGGQVTPLNNVYVLTNGNVSNFPLGNFNINNVEDIAFDLGVDYTANHGNTSNYTSQHPLGPQTPLMDWGWPSGYFFLVIDGKVDNTGDGVPNKQFELHALGDAMLRDVDYLDVTANANAGVIDIVLDVNVEDWLTGLSLATVGVDHSGSSNNSTMCSNTVDYQVFQTNATASVNTYEKSYEITTDYTIAYAPTLNYRFERNTNFNLQILDTQGRKVLVADDLGFEGNFFVRKELNTGMYFAVFTDGDISYTHKFYVKRW
jgi:hypothetical protein